MNKPITRCNNKKCKYWRKTGYFSYRDNNCEHTGHAEHCKELIIKENTITINNIKMNENTALQMGFINE